MATSGLSAAFSNTPLYVTSEPLLCYEEYTADLNGDEFLSIKKPPFEIFNAFFDPRLLTAHDTERTSKVL